MGYYQAGDYYVGDPWVALVRGGSTLQKISRRFFPGVGPNIAIGKKLVKGAAKLLRSRKGKKRQMIGRMGRHRRMNPLNPRALRRALRRAKGFERFARHVIHFTRPTKTRRFRFGRKRRSHF